MFKGEKRLKKLVWSSCLITALAFQSYTIVTAGLTGFWVDGDIHLHSNYSDDATSTPQQIKDTALARGLKYVILTDHSNCFNPDFPAWNDAANLTDGNFIFGDGCEASNDVNGHINCFPLDLATFNRNVNFADRDNPTGYLIKQIHDAGGLAIVNHPETPGWVAYDWNSYNYDGLEIWNGGYLYDLDDQATKHRWVDDLGRGKNTVITGGSDNHRYDDSFPGSSGNPGLGNVKTAVFVSSLTYTNIIDAIKNGRVVVHDYNNMIDLQAYRGSAFIGMPGDMNVMIAPGETVTFKFSGYSRVSSNIRLWYIKAGEQSGNLHSAFQQAVNGNFDFTVNQTINEERIYYCDLWHSMGLGYNNRDYAFTGAIRLKPNGAANWNSNQGTWRRDLANARLSQTNTSTSLAVEQTKAVTNLCANGRSSNFTMTTRIGIVSKTGNSEERIGIIAQKSFFPNAIRDRALILRQNKLWLLDENSSWVASVPFTYNNLDQFWFKFKISGDMGYGKVWKVGTTEPSNWNITGTFSTHESSGGPTGMVGLYAARTSAWFTDVEVVDDNNARIIFTDGFNN